MSATPEDQLAAKREARRKYQAEYRARTRTTPPRKPAECATDSGYKAHRRKGETPCGACKRAHADKWNEYASKAERPSLYGRKKVQETSG